MIKYWPQREYTGNKGVKRQSLKAGLDTFDAAVAQVNEWEQAHRLLWAWVDVRSDQGKERVKLNKAGEEWSGVAPVIVDAEKVDESAPGIPPESNKNPKDDEMENNTASSRGKRYDDMTKRKAVAMIAEIGITKAARELGIGIPTLNRWRKSIGSVADPEQKEAHPEPVTETVNVAALREEIVQLRVKVALLEEKNAKLKEAIRTLTE